MDLIASTLGTLYWQGSRSDGRWNTLTAPIGGLGNWSTDPAGATNAGGTPGAATAVIFSSQAGTVGSPVTATTLETPFTIDRLVFNNETNGGAITGVTIAPGASGTLTLTPASSANGINVQAGAPSSIGISAPVILGSAQTWTVADAASTLTLSGTVNLGANALTLAGSGTKTISGLISGTTTPGTIGMTITGGVVNLANNGNTFTGDIDLSGGKLVYTQGTATTVGQLARRLRRGELQNHLHQQWRHLPGQHHQLQRERQHDHEPCRWGRFQHRHGRRRLRSGFPPAHLYVDDGTVAGTLAPNAAQLQGSGKLTKTGTGTLVLRNQNVFAGEIDIQNGLLQVSGVTAFGLASAGTTIRSGAALNLNGQVMTDLEPLTIHGVGLTGSPIAVIYNSSTTAATFRARSPWDRTAVSAARTE